MKKGKLIFSLVLLILVVSLVSAGFGDWIKGITGQPVGPQSQGASVNVAGQFLPQITEPTVVSGATYQPIENDDPAPLTITISVEVTDNDGVANIIDSTVFATLTDDTTATVIKTDNPCTLVNGDVEGDGLTKGYECYFDMNYYDPADYYDLYIEAQDQEANTATMTLDASGNNDGYLTYELLSAMTISPGSISWFSVSPNTLDQVADDDPVVVTNTGNYDGPLQVEGYDLSDIDANEFIPASSFTVDIDTGGAAECDVAVSGTVLTHDSPESVVGSDSNPGPGPSPGGEEELFYCLDVPGVSSQTYSTAQAGESWYVIYGP